MSDNPNPDVTKGGINKKWEQAEVLPWLRVSCHSLLLVNFKSIPG